jgi:16S rRNA G527 N7-methylase RsmG
VKAPDDSLLVGALVEQARLGILGLAPTEAIAHSRRYEQAIPMDARVVDIGSGAGIPGLVVAWDRRDVRMTMVDSRLKRADQLTRLIRRLGLRERVDIVCARVEAMDDGHAGAYDVLVARRFGAPATVVAAADRLVRDGGLLIVSAAPDDRWDHVSGWVTTMSAPEGLVVLTRKP